MNKNLIDEKASEISQWIQEAVGDMAYDMDEQDISSCYGKEWRKKILKAKKNGVTDIKGWLADEFYNDPKVLQDLCGDRIFDAATQLAGTARNPDNSLHFIAIAKKMQENSHTALTSALDKLIERRVGQTY